jgi:hypothetical protein
MGVQVPPFAKNMKDKIVRGKHRKNCDAIRLFQSGEWDTPWSCVHDTAWLNGNGTKCKKKFNGHQWIQIPCNDPDCKAELWIRSDAIIKAYQEE